jgi:hypothetical protein
VPASLLASNSSSSTIRTLMLGGACYAARPDNDEGPPAGRYDRQR